MVQISRTRKYFSDCEEPVGNVPPKSANTTALLRSLIEDMPDSPSTCA